MENYLTIFKPIILTILSGFLTWLGAFLIKLAPQIYNFIILHIGATKYNKMRLIGYDAWRYADENFRIGQLVSDVVQSKIVMFETFIKRKIPSITDVEIEDIRQAIAGEINKDKPIIENSIKSVNVVTKYYDVSTGEEIFPK